MKISLILLLLLHPFINGMGQVRNAEDKPNVLFIAIDDMNDWTTLFDEKNPIKTPNLQRLAKRGIFFENAYYAAPACSPSRAAIMSGRAPHKSGIVTNNDAWADRVPDAEVSPRYFMANGYDTRTCGKIFHHGPQGNDPKDKPSFQVKGPWSINVGKPEKNYNEYTSPPLSSTPFDWGERELLTQYPTIAGIWFDPVRGVYNRPELFPIDETYKLIRQLSPHALISFKQGANGDEDFMAPERGGNVRVAEGNPLAQKVYSLNQDKQREVCNTMQKHEQNIKGENWGYNKGLDGHHLNVEEVKKLLGDAKVNHFNLLLNTGPLPDGSVHPEDVKTLTELQKL